MDINYTGYIKVRKNIIGIILILGKFTIRNTCKFQVVIVLNSGETKYELLVYGLYQGLGKQGLLTNWVFIL